MGIIDETYLQKAPVLIPNTIDVSAQPVGTPTNVSKVQALIDKYVPEIMIRALGALYYNGVNNALTLQPYVPAAATVAEQKYQDLIDGKTYVKDGKSFIWEGLRGINKDSLLAYYVYTMYLQNDEDLLTTTGVVKVKAKNAENFSASPKFLRIWHEFMKKYQGGAYNENTPRYTYNAFGSLGIDYYNGTTNNKQRSLAQYLFDQNELDDTAFPELDFGYITDEESYNSFGI